MGRVRRGEIMSTDTSTCRTSGTETEAVFRLRLQQPVPASVRVWIDLGRRAGLPPLRQVAGCWELRVARPPVQRLEYLFEVTDSDGATTMICDPAAPRTPTPFGDHSVLEFPGYREPGWLTRPAAAGQVSQHRVAAPWLSQAVPLILGAPADAEPHEALPLLLVHDGPEYDTYARITTFCATAIASGRLPRHRIALLGPADRDLWYAAYPGYAAALNGAVLPFLRRTTAVSGPVALAGTGLGALAAVHAAWQAPCEFGALFLQSGSFFRADLDAQESGFPRFGQIASFVTAIRAAPSPGALLIGMTCGLAEENRADNRLMAADFAALGHQVRLAEVADAHTWTGWRDALDPHLLQLLGRAW